MKNRKSFPFKNNKKTEMNVKVCDFFIEIRNSFFYFAF